jgi:predicted RNA methylase
LLDLGAGDGRPTQAMAAAGFDRVLATEVSQPMQRLLTDKGFHVLNIDTWIQPAEYDVIRDKSLSILGLCF